MKAPLIARIDHVSIAVRDYQKAERFFGAVLGAVRGAGMADPVTKYGWQIYSLGDLSRLELIRPTGEGSFLDNFLAKREGGVHHITLQTPDIAEARRALEQAGIPTFGHHEYEGAYWKEFFIHPRDAFGVLIQIAEFRSDDWLSEAAKIGEKKRWAVEREGSAVGLRLSHPGGGQVRVELTPKEAERLIADLRQALGSEGV